MNFRIAVLASGRGSNLRALIEARQRGELAADVVGVFSDKPDCGAIALAREQGIENLAIRPRDSPSREVFDEQLFSAVAAVQPDLIVCAGYMRLISEAAVRRCQGRMINIHPSLLPKYPGLDTHARALGAGDAEHGASVHVVIPALDSGPVLAQARIVIGAGDTPETLARRLLDREHPLLVATVGLIASGRLRLGADSATFDGAPLRQPLRLDEDNRLHAEVN